MDELLIFYIGLSIIGCLLIGLNLFIKNDMYSSIITILSCMFVGFIGFFNYSSMSTNYPNRKILALCFALTSLLPFILNTIKINNNKVKPLAIKIITIVIIAINLALIFLL